LRVCVPSSRYTKKQAEHEPEALVHDRTASTHIFSTHFFKYPHEKTIFFERIGVRVVGRPGIADSRAPLPIGLQYPGMLFGALYCSGLKKQPRPAVEAASRPPPPG